MKLQLHYPIKLCKVSQPFGVNWGADYKKLLGLEGHPGQDLVNEPGTVNLSFGIPVRASHNGRVISVETDTNGGHTVVLVTDDQYDYNGAQTYFKTVYAHLKTGSIVVSSGTPGKGYEEGQLVKTGDILGLCGSSGVIPGATVEDPKVSHVHFGLKPAKFIETDASGQKLESPYWANSEQNNGYGGAIDNNSSWSGKYAEDIKAEVDALAIATNIVKETATAPIPNETKSAILQKVEDFLNELKNIITNL